VGVLRRWFDTAEVRRVGTTPDYRFSLANERTYLAWLRTALALIAGGLGVAAFLPPLAITGAREGIAIALLAIGAGVALRSVDRWIRVEIAIRTGGELPPSRAPALLALFVFIGALLLVAAVLIQVGGGETSRR
jgi:putative membrane protein